jgi:hypothetical protein
LFQEILERCAESVIVSHARRLFVFATSAAMKKAPESLATQEWQNICRIENPRIGKTEGTDFENPSDYWGQSIAARALQSLPGRIPGPSGGHVSLRIRTAF